MESEKVAGNCPMGCGETLFLGSGGHVTCSFLECPEPTAAADLLGRLKPGQVLLDAEKRSTREIVAAIERGEREELVAAAWRACSPLQRALVAFAYNHGRQDVRYEVEKFIGRAAETLNASMVRMALGEVAPLDVDFVDPPAQERTFQHPPDGRALKVLDSALRLAERIVENDPKVVAHATH